MFAFQRFSSVFNTAADLNEGWDADDGAALHPEFKANTDISFYKTERRSS